MGAIHIEIFDVGQILDQRLRFGASERSVYMLTIGLVGKLVMILPDAFTPG